MSSKTFLVVDIGNKNIKLLWGGYDKTYFINEYEIVPTPEKAIKDGKIIDIEAIVDTISVFKKRSKQDNLILTVGGTSVITRDILLPVSSDEDYEKILGYEAQQYIPVDLKNYSFDFLVEEELEKDGARMARILLVAAPLKQVEQYTELSDSLNMYLEAVDISVNTVPRCIFNVATSTPHPYPENFLLIDIGSQVTQVFIMVNNCLRFTRTIDMGSSNIDNALLFGIQIKELDSEFNLTEDLEKNMELCEKIKKENATIILESDTEEYTENQTLISGFITEGLTPLVNNLNRYLDFYYSREGAKTIEKIFLLGGGSKIKNIDKFFEEKFTTPVEYVYPLQDIEYRGKKSQKKFLDDRLFLLSSIGCLYRKELKTSTTKKKVGI